MTDKLCVVVLIILLSAYANGSQFTFFAFLVFVAFYILPLRHTYRVGRILCLNRIAEIVKTVRSLSYDKSRVIVIRETYLFMPHENIHKYNDL